MKKGLIHCIGSFKNEIGITLVALVVTIIVLLILAGVTIMALTGENGILTKAIQAKQNQEEAELYEKIQTILIEAVTQKYLVTDEQQEIKTYISNRFQKDKLEANIETYNDGYNIIYGIYTKKILYLDSNLKEIKTELAVIGTDKEWEYTVNEDNTITLTMYKKNISGHLDIPNIVENYMVTGLGDDLFNYATNLTSMTLPEGITTIGARTFAFCSNLEWEVSFPSTMQNVGEKAFYGCSKITGTLDTIMSFNVTYGKGVYMKCSSLTGDIQILIDMLGEEETVISESLFSGFSGAIGTLVIPARITSIENDAFYGCSGISGIVFESNNTLKNIGNNAFYQCTGIQGTLDIPSSVTNIGEYAFYEDSSLTGLNLPNSLENLGQYAFYKCSNIVGTVTFQVSLSEVKEYAFSDCSRIEKIVFNSNIDKGVKKIGGRAFQNCFKLKNIDFPSTLEKIENAAFYGGSNILNLYLPNSLNTIGGSAFKGCKNLNILQWPSKLKEIGGSAFIADVGLTNLPDKIDNLTVIYGDAFNGCTLLGTEGENNVIEWLENSNITTIKENCFKDCTNLTGDYTGEIYNKNNVKITISGSPFSGTSVNLVKELNLEGKTKIEANEFAGVTKFVDSNQNEITQITIPNTVTSIGDYAFSGCSSITSIELPDTITSIGTYAFSNCTNLSNINLPNNTSYTTIANYLFQYCKSLKNIVIPNDVTIIGNNAFYEAGLESLDVPGNVKTIGMFAFANNKSLTELNLGEGIEQIGSQFIRASALTELTIPDSVTTLGSSVFHYCTKLKKVTIGKGVTEIPSNMLWVTNNVESIAIKGKITTIGSGAFNDSSKLTTLDMDWSNVVKIESKAFRNCSSLTGNIKLNAACSIAEDAFDNCALSISK